MAVQPLTSLPASSAVFIDANIFIYAFNRSSHQCEEFVLRCARQEIAGIVSFEVIHEATHQFMMIEAVAKRVIQKPSVHALNANPAGVAGLSDYWKNTRAILDLGVLLAPCSEAILDRAQSVRASTGLLTNDSLIVATMQDYGVVNVATNDKSFARVAGISQYAPQDIP